MTVIEEIIESTTEEKNIPAKRGGLIGLQRAMEEVVIKRDEEIVLLKKKIEKLEDAPEEKSISIKEILLMAGQEFYLMWQWLETVYSKSDSKPFNNHLLRAETFVELIEIWDCGSVGGYGKGMDKLEHHTLWERFVYLYDKYVGDQAPFTKRCYNGMTYDKLNTYFTRR